MLLLRHLSPLLFLISTAVMADVSTATRADSHAPLGVMGDHLHAKGEWMLSYRFMRMSMAGNRDGRDDLSPQEVLAQGFMATPLEMTTDMHMFGGMYAPSDAITLMAMLPVVDRTMDHVNGMAVKFTTDSEGIGDLKLSGLIRMLDTPQHKAHFNLGLSAPTGSIDEKDTIPTPMGMREVRLPYPMQIGSGTWDLLAGATYTGYAAHWSWGGQASAVIRLQDENDNDYALGDVGRGTLWLARQLQPQLSVSGRVAYTHWGDIDGADPTLNPMMIPTADPDLRGGERIDVGLGMNWLHASGHRLAIEWLEPVFQDLDGPQLKSDGMLQVGWQKAF